MPNFLEFDPLDVLKVRELVGVGLIVGDVEVLRAKHVEARRGLWERHFNISTTHQARDDNDDQARG